MKLKNVAVVVAALVLAVGMTACGGSSSTADLTFLSFIFQNLLTI